MTVLVDGQPLEEGLSILPDHVEGQLTFVDGSHAVKVAVADLAGNTNTATATFIVTTAPPVVAFTSPAPVTNQETIALSGTVTGGAVTSVSFNGVAATITGTAYTDPYGNQAYLCGDG